MNYRGRTVRASYASTCDGDIVNYSHDVEEAVALGDRVALFEQGKFSFDLLIDLPRPHPRGSGEFARLKEYVLNRVLSEKAVAAV